MHFVHEGLTRAADEAGCEDRTSPGPQLPSISVPGKLRDQSYLKSNEGRDPPISAKWSPLALAGLIEGEVIPRMLAAHRDEVRHVPAGLHSIEASVTLLEADAFARVVLDNETYSLIRIVDEYIDRGLTVQTILVELLAPAARWLGEAWDDDRCDFIDVTMGLWRLQEIVHDLAARFPCAYANRSANRRALFAALPGNQHSLGLAIVEDCFRRSGWQTTSMVAARDDELVTLVGAKWFEIVGLTVTCDTQLSGLPDIISAIRSGSRNPRLGVMVGGPSVVSQPHLALQSGADATAADARQAVVRAEILLEMLPSWITSPC